MIGETVTVELKSPGVRDEYGELTYESTQVSVDNVLVAPGPQVDNVTAVSPDGVKVVYTLYFPKAYTGPSLRGGLVMVRGEKFRVVGDPKPYPNVNTPTLWNMPVQVEAIDAE